MSIETGGAAIPNMTLRRWYAGQAMIALMSSEPWVRGMNSHAAKEDTKFKTALAQQSWAMADAMLATEKEPSVDQGGAA